MSVITEYRSSDSARFDVRHPTAGSVKKIGQLNLCPSCCVSGDEDSRPDVLVTGGEVYLASFWTRHSEG